MIHLTRLNDSDIVVNAELIQTVEATPDTIITLTSGHTIVVKDTVDEVIRKFKDYKRDIFSLNNMEVKNQDANA